MRKSCLTCVSGAMLLIVGMSGCTKDAAFDQLTEKNGIDMTISVANGGLTIPLGSTDKIYLSELIDPESSDVINVDEYGDYQISKTGNIDATSFNVDRTSIQVTPPVNQQKFTFEIDPQQIFQNEYMNSYVQSHDVDHITLADLINNAVEEEGLSWYINKYGLDNSNGQVTALWNNMSQAQKEALYAELMAEMNIPSSFNANCDNLEFAENTSFPLSADNVDEALLDVLKIAFDPSTNNIGMNLSVSGLPNADAPYKISIDEFKLTMPYYVYMSNAEYVTSGKSNEVLINKELQVSNGEAKLDINLKLDSIRFADNDPLVNNLATHKLSREGDVIAFAGKASISNMQIKTSQIYATKKADGSVWLSLPEITITPSISKINTQITEVRGHFNPTIDEIKTEVNIDLGDDLDFLKNKNMTLDLMNPVIQIELSNPCPIALMADIVLTADNGKAPITYSNVSLTPAVGDVIKIMLNANNEGPDGAQQNMVYYKNAALSTLLEPMPDHIEVTINVKADTQNAYTFPLGQDFSVSGNYNVGTPLEFNKVHIIYDEVEEDVWGDHPEDITDYISVVNNAELSFKSTSDIPMTLKLSLSANGKDGKENPSLINCQISEIKQGTTNVSASVSIPDVAAIKDLIFRLEGEGQNCKLSSHESIKLDDIAITLKNLNIDLNDK